MNRVIKPSPRVIALITLLAGFAVVGCGKATTPRSQPLPPAAESPEQAQASGEDAKPTDNAVPDLGPTATEAAFNDDKLGIAFPQTLGQLKFVESHRYPQPGLRYSLRYEDGEVMKVDIYIYDGGLSDIPTGHDDPAIIMELANAESGIRYYEQQGAYLDVEKLQAGVYPENIQGETPRYQWSRYQYRQSPGPGISFTGLRISETFIRGFMRHFVKIRVTYQAASADASLPERDQVLQTVSKLLQAA